MIGAHGDSNLLFSPFFPGTMDQSLKMNNHHALGLHILVQTTPPENWEN